MGQKHNTESFDNSQPILEATERPGNYRAKIKNRTAGYFDDINAIITIYRKPHQLYEQGEILALNAELFNLDFNIIRVVLAGKKKRVINIPRDEFEMVSFEVPIHSHGSPELLKAVRIANFLKRSPLRERKRGRGSKKREVAG